MKRKEAEKLLAALIFDDLDEASKTELLTYLQTDNELRERLADMRMAVKVASDTVQQGPDPVLGKRRLKRLARLARHGRTRPKFFTPPRLAAAAAIFIIAAVLLPSLEKASERSTVAYQRAKKARHEERGERGSTSTWDRYNVPTEVSSPSRRTTKTASREGLYLSHSRNGYDVPTGPSSRGRRTAATDSSEGVYAFDPPADRPSAAGSEQASGPIPTDGRHFAKAKYNIWAADPQTSIRSGDDQPSSSPATTEKWVTGYQPPSGRPGLTKKWDAPVSSTSKPHSWVTGGSDSYNYSNTRSVVDMGSSDVSGGTMPPPPGGVGNGGLYCSYESDVRVVDNIAGFPGGGYGVMGSGGGGYGGGGMMGRHGGDDKMGQFPVGGIAGTYRGGGYGGMGYGDGGGTMPPSPGGEYGGMGGMMGRGQAVGGGYGGTGGYGGGRGGLVSTGRDGGMGSYGAGTMGPSTGSGDSYSRYDGFEQNKAFGSEVATAIKGSESGDSLVVGARTYNGNIDFKGGKEITLFSGQPDDISADADGDSIADSIAMTGKYFITNGKTAAFKPDGSIEHKDIEFKSRIIDNFTVYVDKESGPSPVGVVTGEPVTAAKSESATPSPAKPKLIRPSEPAISNVLGSPDEPSIKLQTDKSSLPHVSLEDIKTRTWFDKSWEKQVQSKNEADSRKADDEPVTEESYQYIPEKDRVPVTATERATRRDMAQQGQETEKEEEATMEETSADHGTVTITDCDFEGNIATRVEAQDQIQRLLSEAEKANFSEYSGIDLSKLGAKKDSRGVPILGDMPLVGRLFREEGKKRPLSEEETKQIVAYLKEYRKSQPEGGPGLAALRTQPELEAKRIIDRLSTIDDQSGVDLVTIPGGEDEPELPPSSRFKLVPVNPWVMTERDFFSTFALDVDTASYTLCRRYIRGGFLPPAGAVRMEEFINYFNYHYPQRTNPTFAVHAEAAPSPFARKETNLTLLKIGVKARTIGRDQRKAAHLIFVVDASASMGQPDRLPLVQHALDLLVHQLSEVDRVSLISCASEARLHLEAVPASERDRIRQAIYAIQPAGPTNLLAGLKLGYAAARRSFAPKQINHVVLCSDGVANVGQTEAKAVLDEVAADRKQGITITCVGVGYGSYNDIFLESLANRGDGSYMFLDSARQAQRVFVRQLAATLQTVAKDARIQVEFNPNRVRRYRLIGYENRDIEDKRFRDDTIDAGEVGSGQCSTALYELELIGQPSADRQADLGTVFVRYRNTETGQIEEISSRLSSVIVRRPSIAEAPRFFLAAGAARFAEILRQSEHARYGNLTDVFRVVEQVSVALPLDRDVRELAGLIRKAEHLPRSP